MKFLEFLQTGKDPNFWNEHKVVVFRGGGAFRGNEYPLFFFRMLFDFLKQKDVMTSSYVKTEDRNQLWAMLEQSFLGKTSTYWLGNITERFKKGKKRKTSGKDVGLAEVLSLYRGPHTVLFFLPRDHKLSLSSQKRICLIDIEDSFSVADAERLFTFFEVSIDPRKKRVLHDIVQHGRFMSLDSICMVMNYLLVTSLRAWMTQPAAGALKRQVTGIVEPELSLFQLSKTFFTKQSKKFFPLWAECQNEYSVPFWVAYWSEQLWRAYYVVKFLKQNNFPAARRFAFRLPSSFLKYDWRSCSLEELSQAYTMVYDIDFAFKTGSTFCSLDLMYNKYFLGKFSNRGSASVRGSTSVSPNKVGIRKHV